MDTINLFINSKNCIKSSGIVLVNLPNSYIQAKRNESWTVTVKSFQSIITWYNIQTNYNDQFMIADNPNFENPIEIRLNEGNPNIYEFLDELTTKLTNYITVSYNQRTNKFLFSSDANYYLKCINCSQFLGFDNDMIVPITTEGVYSDYSINLTSDQLIYMRIDGDIGLQNAGLTNIDTPEFYPNDVLFSFTVNQVPNSLIDYQAPYAERWKQYINTQSDTIDQFTLRLTNEEGLTLPTFNDFMLHLQFERVKNGDKIYQDKIIKSIDRIANYMQEIYLLVANYFKIY